MSASILQIEDLTIYYGKALAVDGVSMMVEDGETVAVIGPNGAGKTSLLRAVAGLTPSNGRILFREKTISGLKAYEISRQGISLCPEGRRLFPELTVRQNLDLGAIMRKDHKKVKTDLERFAFVSRAEKPRRPDGPLLEWRGTADVGHCEGHDVGPYLTDAG